MVNLTLKFSVRLTHFCIIWDTWLLRAVLEMKTWPVQDGSTEWFPLCWNAKASRMAHLGCCLKSMLCVLRSGEKILQQHNLIKSFLNTKILPNTFRRLVVFYCKPWYIQIHCLNNADVSVFTPHFHLLAWKLISLYFEYKSLHRNYTSLILYGDFQGYKKNSRTL